jgi:hypothetical protein
MTSKTLTGAPLYGTKTKMDNTPRFTPCCRFPVSKCTQQNKINSNIIFVGISLRTYHQQKWISFLLPFLADKNDYNSEDSMT